MKAGKDYVRGHVKPLLCDVECPLAVPPEGEPESEAERRRAANIAANQEQLRKLGLI